MFHNIIVVNDDEYPFNSINIDYSKKEIYIQGNDRNLELLLNQWYDEAIDHGQGINPNYKKNIGIDYNNDSFFFEGCWVCKVSRHPTKAIISYDFANEN